MWIRYTKVVDTVEVTKLKKVEELSLKPTLDNEVHICDDKEIFGVVKSKEAGLVVIDKVIELMTNKALIINLDSLCRYVEEKQSNVKIYLRVNNGDVSKVMELLEIAEKSNDNISPVYLHDGATKTTQLLEQRISKDDKSLIDSLLNFLGEENVKIVSTGGSF